MSAEIIQLKDRLGIWQLVLLQLGIQSGARSAKVGYTGRGGHTGTIDDDDVLIVVAGEVGGDFLKELALAFALMVRVIVRRPGRSEASNPRCPPRKRFIACSSS